MSTKIQVDIAAFKVFAQTLVRNKTAAGTLTPVNEYDTFSALADLILANFGAFASSLSDLSDVTISLSGDLTKSAILGRNADGTKWVNKDLAAAFVDAFEFYPVADERLITTGPNSGLLGGGDLTDDLNLTINQTFFDALYKNPDWSSITNKPAFTVIKEPIQVNIIAGTTSTPFEYQYDGSIGKLPIPSVKQKNPNGTFTHDNNISIDESADSTVFTINGQGDANGKFQYNYVFTLYPGGDISINPVPDPELTTLPLPLPFTLTS